MTRNEALALIIGLACETSDRDVPEQKALLDWAWRCDREHNALVTGNKGWLGVGKGFVSGWRPYNLVGMVLDTLQDGNRAVAPPKGWDAAWKRWEDEGGFTREHASYVSA